MEKFVSIGKHNQKQIIYLSHWISVSLFNVVTFPNDPCDAGTRNGTCYTKYIYYWLFTCNTYSNTVFLGKNAIKKEAQTMGAAQTDTACVALVRYNVLFLNLS